MCFLVVVFFLPEYTFLRFFCSLGFWMGRSAPSINTSFASWELLVKLLYRGYLPLW